MQNNIWFDMRKTWISKTLFCSSKAKKKQNEIDNKDTLLMSAYDNNKFKRLSKDFDLSYINKEGREECERIAMDEFILL